MARRTVVLGVVAVAAFQWSMLASWAAERDYVAVRRAWPAPAAAGQGPEVPPLLVAFASADDVTACRSLEE